MKNTDIYDSNLNIVLDKASNEDLDPLVEYLSKKFSCDLVVDTVYKENSPNHSKYADLIAKEIRDMGGNSFMNMFRGFEGPSYHEVVCDVASKLKASYDKNDSIENIENSILEVILTKALEKMTNEEKQLLLKEMGGKSNINIALLSTKSFLTLFRTGGFASYQMTLIIANQMSRMLLGRGLMFATNTALMKSASLITGPFALAVTSVWSAIDMSGPAYKVTIPCVIHIAMLRKKVNRKRFKFW
ncbi:YaaW family protein [Psychrobacter cibarius]|uniref:YaaW family protein n=1 Tax=Psychrobacter cibarius TaxID=282669 RepID=UPI003FD66083